MYKFKKVQLSKLCILKYGLRRTTDNKRSRTCRFKSSTPCNYMITNAPEKKIKL